MKSPAKAAVLLVASFAPFLSVATPHLQSVTFPYHYNGEVKGAAYFMNNDPTGNYLFVADIGADAKVILSKAYYTGGKGGHGTGRFNSALFSQGSIAATNHRTWHLNIVILVNAGSNTVTAFEINPNKPSELKMLGRPVYSGGNFPISVAINKAGDMVCALNTGIINGVSCFRLDSHNGLIPLPNTTRFLGLHQTRIPSGPDMTASEVTFTEDGKKLVVAVKGLLDDPKNNPGFIAIWDIYEDMSLSTEFMPMIGGIWIWALTQVPGKNAFVGGDSATGVQIYNLDALAHNASARAQNLQVPGQIAICWSDYSKVTDNYYLVDLAVPSIDEIHLDANLNATIVAIHRLDEYDGASNLSINHINGKE
ncbi:hypothetical protein AX15_005477 [Amanita polypyramis BW_CC]|nr:hypothetical protein AX15_005477 [Amanita polypyramis BW_CC]